MSTAVTFIQSDGTRGASPGAGGCRDGRSRP